VIVSVDIGCGFSHRIGMDGSWLLVRFVGLFEVVCFENRMYRVARGVIRVGVVFGGLFCQLGLRAGTVWCGI